jgi:intracellular septation protein A
MDVRVLVKNFAISLFPLLVFVAADHFFSRAFGPQKGLKYALIAAVAVGAFQAIFIYVREKRFDKLILFDTGLITALGAVSFVSGNDLFFKLKPALVELILVILLGMVCFVTPRILLVMMGRYTEGMTITDTHLKMMRRAALGMFFIFLAHTALIVHAAFFLSREAWAFISGGLFYIIAGVYFAVLFVLGRIKRKKLMQQYYGDDLVELKDEKGRSLGLFPKSTLRTGTRH